MRRTSLAFSLVAVICAAAARLAAHDFWLVPEFFSAATGWHLHVYASTGERFPESMAALAPERVASARLVGAEASQPITRMHRAGNSLALEVLPPAEGQWYVAVEVKPRRIDLSADDFNGYLAHDGLPHILELRRQRGELEQPGRERYSRGAKALVRVGSGGPDVWERVLGHTIELVPLSDPRKLTPPDTLAVQLLFRGEPVRGAVVAAGYAGFEGEGHASESRSDAAGIARLAVAVAGRWYVRSIHMIERPEDPEFDWESFWASLTFEVPPPEVSG